MNKKAFFIVALYFSTILFNACIKDDCENVQYYDFSSLEIVPTSLSIPLNDSLQFKIHIPDREYMAENHFQLNLIESAMAFKCDNGALGFKNPITKVEITSNSSFNDEFPAGALLNSLIKVKFGNQMFTNEFANLKDVYAITLFPRTEGLEPLFYMSERPTSSTEHLLTCTVTKDDGSVISSVSDTIVWKTVN